MQLGYVGINYKNTDLSVRDKITFTDSGIADFMQQAEEAGVNQCMCLSTCNRCEVFYLYAVSYTHLTLPTNSLV